MADFDTAARQEAERRYPDSDFVFRAVDEERAAFEAGARWAYMRGWRARAALHEAERAEWQGRVKSAEAALAEVAALAAEWRRSADEPVPDSPMRDWQARHAAQIEAILATAERIHDRDTRPLADHIDALMRLLVDSGDATPMARRQVVQTLREPFDAEQTGADR